MTRSGLQKTWIRILLTCLTVAVMVLIFSFSTEPAERSDQTSGQLSMTVISVIHPDYETYTPVKKEEVYADVQHYVRKAAHFTEYMMLGLLLRLCLESWFGRKRFLGPASWAAGALYACTDELHQIRTDGRSGQFTDVLLDSCGVLAGVLLGVLLLRMLERRGKR